MGNYFIQLTLKNALHQWPEYSVLALPLSSNRIISNEIITPIISDYSYAFDNDEYMLMYLDITGKGWEQNIKSNNKFPMDVFCQFKTESNNKYFKAIEHINTLTYTSGIAKLDNLKIQFKNRDGDFFNLNNKDHSFTLKITHKNSPQLM